MFLAFVRLSVIFCNILSATGGSVVDSSVVVVVVVAVDEVDSSVVVDCAVELVISTMDLSVVITKSKPDPTTLISNNNKRLVV